MGRKRQYEAENIGAIGLSDSGELEGRPLYITAWSSKEPDRAVHLKLTVPEAEFAIKALEHYLDEYREKGQQA